MLKLNDADNYDHIQLYMTELLCPIAYKKKLDELIAFGMTEKAAKHEMLTVPIEMEFYYEPDYGLMMVEAEAVEAGTIYSPYTGEMYEDQD